MRINLLLAVLTVTFLACGLIGCMHVCADYEAGKGNPVISGTVTTPNPPISINVGTTQPR